MRSKRGLSTQKEAYKVVCSWVGRSGLGGLGARRIDRYLFALDPKNLWVQLWPLINIESP